MKDTQTYPLRLPRSLKDAVERLSREHRTSINQFVATAVAEKLAALQSVAYFANRKARANFKAFDKIMKRKTGKPPRKIGEMPSIGLPKRPNSSHPARSTERAKRV
jgi:hypothetical protein